jgi:hypothetical protein
MNETGELIDRIRSEEPELEDLVDFFLCTAATFDVVAPVLELAKQRLIAIQLCEQLGLQKSSPVYSGRSEVIRLHTAFAMTSGAWDQFQVFSKDAAPELRGVVDFVELVYACDGVIRQLGRKQVQEKMSGGLKGNAKEAPVLSATSKLLLKFMTTLEEDDDERIPDAQVRVKVADLAQWELEE